MESVLVEGVMVTEHTFMKFGVKKMECHSSDISGVLGTA
jgi:hypothetical protein